MMELTPKTRIFTLIKQHDFMLDFLAEYAPEFAKLKNPVLRNTMGRVATLEMAASLAGVPLEQLMQDIRAAIEDRTGEQVAVKAEGVGSPLLTCAWATMIPGARTCRAVRRISLGSTTTLLREPKAIICWVIIRCCASR